MKNNIKNMDSIVAPLGDHEVEEKLAAALAAAKTLSILGAFRSQDKKNILDALRPLVKDCDIVLKLGGSLLQRKFTLLKGSIEIRINTIEGMATN